MSEPVELPHPWQEVYDPASRLNYYWNSDTDETVWELDEVPGLAGVGKIRNVKAKEAAARAAADPVELPPGWAEVLDEETGDVYFWNCDTDETTWDPPSMSDGAAAGSDKTGSAAVATKKKQARKPREVIAAESYKEEEYVKKVVPKSDASREVIRTALKRSFIFESLGPEDQAEMIDSMTKVEASPGDRIIVQGDSGDNFYVIESGSFDILIDGVGKVAERGPGDSFGEKALLYNCPRAATVTAASAAKLWALDRVTFRHMIAHTSAEKLAAIVTALRAVPLLEPLTDLQLNRIAEAVKVSEYKDGDVIIKKGDQGDEFFMVKSGRVVCKDIRSGGTAVPDLALGPGDFFGERALLLSEPRAANVVATGNVSCLVLGRSDFNTLLGPLHDIIDEQLGMRVLSGVPVLRPLRQSERKRVVAAFRKVKFRDGDNLAQAGRPLSAFYVIKEGICQCRTPGKPASLLQAGDFVGDVALLEASATAEADVVASGEVQCFTITKDEFEGLFGPLRDLLGRAPGGDDDSGAASSGAAGGAGGSSGEGRPGTRDVSDPSVTGVHFHDLEHMTTLGAGTFGRVKLVKHRPTGAAYALKILQKAQVVDFKQTTNVMNERDVMAMVDHPFVLKLVATFKDKDCLYMLLELVSGGELFTLLANQETGYVSSDAAKFYAACVISALEALHERNILYRDLKPENMLIDAQGYIKVVDMGFAKVVPERTFTLCGTPEYLAPELVLGKGHHKGVDYWAAGILIYEMLCGYSPFADHENGDQMVICRNIVKAKLEYPSYMKDKLGKDLISKLLNRDPVNRFGCRKGGAKEICKHKWFKAIDWEKLVAKKLKAPWVPPLKDPFDTSHFDFDEPDEPITPYVDDGSGWSDNF